MSAKRGLTAVLCLAAVASCDRPADQRTDTMDVQQAIQQERESLPPDVLAQLDSGGAAFRADDHQGALTHYTKATELAPELAAAWFGVYMAHLRAALPRKAPQRRPRPRRPRMRSSGPRGWSPAPV